MAQKHVLKISSIYTYFKDESKLIERGENAMESGDVLKMNYNDQLKIIKGNVHASMRDKLYQVEIYLTEDKNILKSTCTCPRGQLNCHHVAALALFGHYNISTTDQSCSWSAPKQVDNAGSVRISELFPPAKPFRACQSQIGNDKVEAFKQELDAFGGAVGWSWLLQPKITPNATNLVPDIGELIFSNNFNSSANKISYFEEMLKLSEEKIINIAKETVGQSTNPKWLVSRKLRLTASNFGLILKCCQRKSFPKSLFSTLTGSYNLDGVKAVQWGKQHEKDALKQFAEHIGLPVQQTGIWMHACGYLGASPDGLVNNNAIIEIKCPFKFRNADLHEVLKIEKNYIVQFSHDTNEYAINKTHNYYHQIQGQLYLTNRELCYFVIWTPNAMMLFHIYRDSDWENNINILRYFYVNDFLNHVHDM